MIPIETIYQHYLTCSGVSTDTRNIQPGSMFFALKGPNFNANAFAGEALAKGASYAIVDDPEYATDTRVFVVTDTLQSLQALARYHRKQLNIPIVGLTGSNGKTTTKELIYSVLSQKFRTYATRGNLNNHIGVPLTLLAIGPEVEVAVIEMGANKQGDIDELVHICMPTHGLITNIGKAHLEGFGGLSGVRKGKGELFDFLEKSGGIVIVNADDTTVVEMAIERKLRYFFRYEANANLLSESPFVKYSVDNQEFNTHLTGKYNFHNIQAALAVGRVLGVEDALAHAAVCGYVPENNRSQVIVKNSTTILLDAYNANPSSMKAALENFNALDARKKVVILGDMFELGDDAPAEHAAIGTLLAECNFDTVLLTGDLMQYALPAVPKAFYFPDRFGLNVWLQEHPFPDTHVFIKGSRGMGLEKLLPMISS